ncbi:hypothetical protein RchiOBHm_Chr1g0323191 [Rosa chinensis]|uniref:Uncharacterized protein n=1 Tax=Rosa chinensis TaxID=74649 RepID=A0A2P6S9G6_ROSCH|nr:hypothetical protein RchiOBHm_Chr1g0323191 [Rosa chinensis]
MRTKEEEFWNTQAVTYSHCEGRRGARRTTVSQSGAEDYFPVNGAVRVKHVF